MFTMFSLGADHVGCEDVTGLEIAAYHFHFSPIVKAPRDPHGTKPVAVHQPYPAAVQPVITVTTVINIGAAKAVMG